MINPSLLCPGRFERLIEIPLPDRSAREYIFAVHAGFSGRDIAAVVCEASLMAIEDYVSGERVAQPTVTADHFARALGRSSPLPGAHGNPATGMDPLPGSRAGGRRTPNTVPMRPEAPSR